MTQMDPTESRDPQWRGFVNRRFRVRFPGAAPLLFGLFFAFFETVDRVTTYLKPQGADGRHTLPISGLTRDEARAYLRGDP